MKSKILGKYSQIQAESLVEEKFRAVIIDAAEKFGVDARLIAAILMDEITRIDFWDRLQDFVARRIIAAENHRRQRLIGLWQLFSREDIGTQSFGLAQMNVNTFKDLVREGYLEPPEDYQEEQLAAVLCILENDDAVPALIGGQIRRTIDHWQQENVDISQRPEICGTLYSIGLTGDRGVHPHPEPNQRGMKIAEMARQMRLES